MVSLKAGVTHSPYLTVPCWVDVACGDVYSGMVGVPFLLSGGTLGNIIFPLPGLEVQV